MNNACRVKFWWKYNRRPQPCTFFKVFPPPPPPSIFIRPPLVSILVIFHQLVRWTSVFFMINVLILLQCWCLFVFLIAIYFNHDLLYSKPRTKYPLYLIKFQLPLLLKICKRAHPLFILTPPSIRVTRVLSFAKVQSGPSTQTSHDSTHLKKSQWWLGFIIFIA